MGEGANGNESHLKLGPTFLMLGKPSFKKIQKVEKVCLLPKVLVDPPPPYSFLNKPCKLSSSQDLVVGLVLTFLDLDIFK